MQDRRAGMIAAQIANSYRAKESDPYLNWTDFFPESKPPVEPQSEEEMLAAMAMWTKRSTHAEAN